MKEVEIYYGKLFGNVTTGDHGKLSLDETLAVIIAEQKRRKSDAKRTAEMMRKAEDGVVVVNGIKRRDSEASQKLLATLPIDENKTVEELRPKSKQSAGGGTVRSRMSLVVQAVDPKVVAEEQRHRQEKEKQAIGGNAAKLGDKTRATEVTQLPGESKAAVGVPKQQQGAEKGGQVTQGNAVEQADKRRTIMAVGDSKTTVGTEKEKQAVEGIKGGKAAVEESKPLLNVREVKVANGKVVTAPGIKIGNAKPGKAAKPPKSAKPAKAKTPKPPKPAKTPKPPKPAKSAKPVKPLGPGVPAKNEKKQQMGKQGGGGGCIIV